MMTLFKDLFNGCYESKKVFVTGHTGFKGSWLALWLAELGANVTGYALEPPTQPNFFDACSLEKKIRSYQGDIRDLKALQNAMSETQPEIVFHLAAQSLVRYSYENPHETYSTNIMGTVNLLETIRHTESVKVCQVITSDKCYENLEKEYAYTEKDRLGGRDPYSSSKACAELTAAAYYQSFFLNQPIFVSTVRAGNVIGGGDWACDRIVVDCINSLVRNEPILVRNPKAIRPWQHVFDVLSGYLTLGMYQCQNGNDFSEGWNFGPNKQTNIQVEDLVKKILDCWGSGSWKSLSRPDQNLHEANLLSLDPGKAYERLGWKSVCSMDEAVEFTIKWYQHYYSNKTENMYEFSLSQIEAYIQRAIEQNLPWTNSKEIRK